MQNTDFIREAFKNLVENLHHDERRYAAYFSKSYQQYVDGKMFNYQDFIDHMQTLKSMVSSIRIEFIHLFGEGEKVCSIHIANAKKKNGEEIKTKVIAVFEIQDNKIVLCDELTYLLSGSEEDKYLGSITSR